jgi:prefoldin subunit 5
MQVKEKEIEKKRMEVQSLQGQLEALRERHTVLRKEVEILQN